MTPAQVVLSGGLAAYVHLTKRAAMVSVYRRALAGYGQIS